METLEVSPKEAIEGVRLALSERDAGAIVELLDDLDSNDLNRVLCELDEHEVAALIRLLGAEPVADLVARLDPADAADLLLRVARPQAADVLEEMDPDDATDVVEELEEDEAEEILQEMEAPEAEEIRELMAYPADSAGGLMTPEFMSVSPDITVDEAIRAIRDLATEAETVYYVYVTGEGDRLLGVLSLRELVLARTETPIEQVMESDVVRVRADADQETAARLLVDRGLLALPVVDEHGRLLGIITSDDVAHVLEEEATEDIARIGGQQPLGEPYITAGVLQIVRKRVIWLFVLFVAQAYTGSVLQHFEPVLATLVSLSFFIPMLIGTGGNVGSQTVTTVVRAMAVEDLDLRDAVRVVRKELVVGAILGAVMGASTLVRAWTMGVDANVGLVVGLSALFVVIWAAVVAAFLPLVLKRLRVDPAVVSAPLITTLVDGTGLFIYFTLAQAILLEI